MSNLPPMSQPGRLQRLVERLRGGRTAYGIDAYRPRIAAVAAAEARLKLCGDGELPGRLRAASTPTERFAVAREAARRALGMRPYDVQVAAGLALHDGRIVEMPTGEGKTLAAVLPAAALALEGRGVHVLTFNDYLARRDADWMSPAYQLLGLEVASVTPGMPPSARRAAYAADITYLTAREAGFDHLRDGLCYHPDQRVQRDFGYAIIDEADSILIDEARIPLVIAGEQPGAEHNATRMAALVEGLRIGVDYARDAVGRNVYLTDQGLDVVEALLGRGPLHTEAGARWLAEARLALHARELLTRDVDYIVRDGAIELVDELTGRVVLDRRWPDGLQAALEAKEGLRFGQEGMVLGTTTLQDFLGRYERVAGMTATVLPEQAELAELYRLDAVIVPPNLPCIRQDLPDRVFSHREAKEAAVLAEVQAMHARRRPVLVGTASVRESEALAARLRAADIPCEVLNAKTDALEAAIIAEAGGLGAVTISTNMAGRGTDIRLGGSDERDAAEVRRLGGLHVIGTNRHESRRIDRQLRGRAGRQGDPGSSVFYVSLEDDLVVKYGVDALLSAEARAHREAALDDPRVTARIEWAQDAIEAQCFDMRRTLWRYAAFLEKQRLIVRDLRDRWLAEPSEPRRVRALGAIDRLWAEHLDAIADLRDGIHWVRLGNQDPMQAFLKRADTLFKELSTQLKVEVEAPSAPGLALTGPGSTWTYLVDDNPLRSALGLHVSGDLALSIGAAVYSPLYMAVALYRRLRKRA